MPIRLFATAVSATDVASFVLMAGVFGLGFLTAQYLQLALHYNRSGRPATAACNWDGTLLLVAGETADRIGERPLVMVGLGLEACASC